MRKTVLFIGGGIETVPGVVLAREMGLRVVVSDRNPKAPCFRHADAALLADTYSADENIAAAQAFSRDHGPIHGVLCLATDVPLTVARTAKALGLPGLDVETARLAMDKLAMKDRFAQRGVRIPWYSQVQSADALKTMVCERPNPLVLKPVDSRGARGVMRLSGQVDLDWAFDYAKKFSPTERVMVEEYLAGPQISTESLMIHGEAVTPGFSDRNYEFLETYQPFFIENGGDMPSFLDAATQEKTRSLAADAARALGIENGVAKGDLVVRDGVPYVIEMAARLSGGYFCTHSIPLNTGVELVRFAILQALDEPFDPDLLKPRKQDHVCQRYLFPKPGRVVSIEGYEEVQARPYIALCEVRVQIGDTIADVENHPGRAGVLTALGSSREEALAYAEDAVRCINIKTV